MESLSIPLLDEGNVTLRVINDFGEVYEEIMVSAIKVDPEIVEFSASQLIRDSLEPIVLKWQTENSLSVKVSTIDRSFGSKHSVEIWPKVKSKYILTAIGFFDQVVTKELIIDIVTPVIKEFRWEVNLHEGLDNIDLTWETENTTNVFIDPFVGETKLDGLVHVPIEERTEFKLLAKGLFGEVEQKVIAHPFPVPVIKQIFTEVPNFQMKTTFKEYSLPKELFATNNIQFTSTVNFNNLEIDSKELKNIQKLPEFTNKNVLVNELGENKKSLSNLYESILTKVQERLKR